MSRKGCLLGTTQQPAGSQHCSRPREGVTANRRQEITGSGHSPPALVSRGKPHGRGELGSWGSIRTELAPKNPSCPSPAGGSLPTADPGRGLTRHEQHRLPPPNSSRELLCCLHPGKGHGPHHPLQHKVMSYSPTLRNPTRKGGFPVSQSTEPRPSIYETTFSLDPGSP